MRKLYGYNNVMAVSKYIQLLAEITEENWVMSSPTIGTKLATWSKGVGVTSRIGLSVKPEPCFSWRGDQLLY